jgi:hypothetical protein
MNNIDDFQILKLLTKSVKFFHAEFWKKLFLVFYQQVILINIF